MPEAHSVQQSIRKVHWRITSQAMLVTETLPLALGTQKLERGKAGRVSGIPILYLPSEVLTHLPSHRLHFLTMLEFALPKTALPIPSSQKSKVRWTVHLSSGKITACFTLHLSLQFPTFYLHFGFGSEVTFLLDCLQGCFVSLGHNHTSNVNGPELKQKKTSTPPCPQPTTKIFVFLKNFLSDIV